MFWELGLVGRVEGSATRKNDWFLSCLSFAEAVMDYRNRTWGGEEGF